MKFTTHLTLHSQATRLSRSASHPSAARVTDGILTLYDTLFQGICTRDTEEAHLLDHNSGHAGCPDFRLELLPLHSPLLGESLLVSFPPLSNMLKFSG